ncbi:MAG: RNA 3'-terminal phosphate cyclase [Candidatus Bathyarchaeales archaeon]
MLEVDGSIKSGSGTILRLAIALASILNEPLHIRNIRAKRTSPGLRPQHLEAVLTAAKICNAEVEGATVGSRELWFKPNEIIGGEIEAQIGTAGSIPMLIMTILPVCAYAEKTVKVHISKGGTDVMHSPTINYLRYVLLPVLKRMGLTAKITIVKYGYYPKGMGEVYLEVQPCRRFTPLRLEEFGNVKTVGGLSVCTFLAEKNVAARQAKAASDILRMRHCDPQIQVINDQSNPMQKGSSIVLWATTDTDVILGGDAIGELGKPSEIVGREAAENLALEIDAQATVDVHLADLLVPYVALTKGESVYLTRSMTPHLDTNIWVAQELLDVEFSVTVVGYLYKIRKETS